MKRLYQMKILKLLNKKNLSIILSFSLGIAFSIFLLGAGKSILSTKKIIIKITRKREKTLIIIFVRALDLLALVFL